MSEKFIKEIYGIYNIYGEAKFEINKEIDGKHTITKDSKMLTIEFLPTHNYYKYDFVSGKNQSNINIRHIFEKYSILFNEKYLNEDETLNTSILDENGRIELKYLNKEIYNNTKIVLKKLNKIYEEIVKEEYEKLEENNNDKNLEEILNLI
jgi:hypothetical protein